MFFGLFEMARPLLRVIQRMNSELLIDEAEKESAEHTRHSFALWLAWLREN